MSDGGPIADTEIQAARDRLKPFYDETAKILVGRRGLIDQIVTGLLTDGHLLLEGVPGLAKTLAVRTCAQAMRLAFKRIQFTPDLLPADVIGTQIYNPRTGEFAVRKGPIFANIVLADEINRAPAKVQSALLEAMQERQVTIGDTTYPLPQPFLVMATQNPIEHEGTYPLPEAQVDRFMLKLLMDYPDRDEEIAILHRMGSVVQQTDVNAVIDAELIVELRATVDRIFVAPSISAYIVDLVRATRRPADYRLDTADWVQFGAGPRAVLALVRAARARAFLQGRGYVTPDDVKSSAPEVMRHRIIVSYEAEAENITADTVVKRILDHIPVP